MTAGHRPGEAGENERNFPVNGTGRIAVNGKILSWKQSRQFEKFMAESPEFRQKFLELSQEKK